MATLNHSPVRDAIIEEISSSIVSGQYAPGQRIPDRHQLCRNFGASSVTVQRAMDQLIRDGFIRTGARRQGTFVVDRPPHLSRYKIIFPYSPHTPSLFFQALQNQIATFSGKGENRRWVTPFYGIGGHRDISAYQELINDVRANRLAGLIFASSAEEFIGTPLFDFPDIPRVALAKSGQLPGIPKLYVDMEGFLEKALAYLASRGKKRVALICPSGIHDSSYVGAFPQLATRHQMTTRRYWNLLIDPASPPAVARTVELLMHSCNDGHSDSCPDSLIIANDQTVSGVVDGLALARVNVRDLDIVAHCNFPIGSSVEKLNHHRIGFDAHRIIQTCIEYIDMQRVGQMPPDFTMIPCVSELEYLTV